MPVFEDISVVGMHFRGAEVKALVATFVPPITLTLEREPSNPYDPNAIKVFYENTHIGYINGADAAFISPHLTDEPHVAQFKFLQESRNNLYPICTVEPA